ncbi:NAD-dependent succinate-semialdehyde dehydrogenase [Nesterenkonia ebinurensis]|uniref:NAD-dependent succinate-semialdehyde dehydrogenase n=1 Tax=Nesterenkonia ebinurensis TaxID=2608252 RepID=UPI00123CC3CA|nr:NAD-dependent succinate-semialdehyde dehydrogenase [Nesterenkonia ebinurensis]
MSPGAAVLSHEDLRGVSHSSFAQLLPDDTTSFTVRSPIDGQVVGTLRETGTEEAVSIADQAGSAFGQWRTLPARQRAEYLLAWAGRIISCTELMAALITLESGKTAAEARAEIRYAADFARLSAEEISREAGIILPAPSDTVSREVGWQALGPILSITPWNFPAALVLRSSAPALAAGCTVVLKPAEQTPLTASLLQQLWEETGAPTGTFTVIPTTYPGTVVAAAMNSGIFRKLTFTGSQATGTALYMQAAQHLMRVSMELGGNAPFIIFEDADLDQAVQELLRCKFRINGQNCTAVNRVYVHHTVTAELEEKLRAAYESLRLGDPRHPEVNVGPVINTAAAEKIRGLVQDAQAQGAQLLCGGSVDGRYVEPSLLRGVEDSMRLFQEEIFGPVLGLSVFETEEEVLHRANRVDVGLAGYLCTSDAARAHRVAEHLECGIVGVNNGAPTGDASIPFGGTKKSGIGRSGGRWGVLEYMETQFRHFER